MNELEAWLASRPECVQNLAKEFPIGTTVLLDGVEHYLLGYTENDMLVLSKINPCEFYDEAMENQIHMCAQHIRDSNRQ
jgi:hypothetical protein